MVIKIASYNDGGSTYNAEAEETRWIDYHIRARLNQPATATVTLSDPTGSLAQKYNVDANDVYIGPARLTIENPAATDIFDGRVMRASLNSARNRLMLECKDWLSQLEDERITYDMREDLDGSGLRESTLEADPDDATAIDVCYTNGANYYVMDNKMSWSNDQFKNYYFVLAANGIGKVKARTGPRTETVTVAAGLTNDSGDHTDLWVDDDNAHAMWDGDESWTVAYTFRTYVGHNTPSDFYVHGSITGARIYVTYSHRSTVDDATCDLQIKYDSDANGTLDAYASIAELSHYDSDRGTIKTKAVYEIPEDLLSKVVSSSGLMNVLFNVNWVSNIAYLYVYYINVEVDVTCSGWSGSAEITEQYQSYALGGGAGEKVLKLDTNMNTAATQVWPQQPYSIVKEVYKHIDDGESGDLIKNYHPLVELTHTATIEHTSGFSTRRFEEMSPLAILQDLAKIDKTAFWMALGSTTVTWKSTFNNGAPTAITDSTVRAWTWGAYDFTEVYNEYHVWGPSDLNAYVDTSDLSVDPGSDSKSTYGTTRAKVIRSVGTASIYETENMGKSLVERDEDALWFLEAEIFGLSSLRLGDEVSITSTYLDLAASVYVIIEWEYHYASDVTRIRLHPRNSTKGFVPYIFADSTIRHVREQQAASSTETFVPVVNTET